MNKTFDFGKIAYNSQRKINRVEIMISLENNKKRKPVFTASANIWNASHTDIVAGGQMLNELRRFYKGNKLFNRIYAYWSKYHLNDMHAGTEKQDKAIDDGIAAGKLATNADFQKVIEYLESINLYSDNGYNYGSAWLYRDIPANDLINIKALLK